MNAKPIAWALVVCFLATTATEARGENSQWKDAAGATARAGTSVGFSEVAQERWSTLGGHVAMGYRLGPLSVEGEYENSKLLYYTGLRNTLRGRQKRIGAALRLYFLRVGRLSGGNSHLLLFADAAVGYQRGALDGVGFARSDYGSGFGWLLDHEVEHEEAGLQKIGWHFGWRLTGAARESEAMARIVCGTKCPTHDSNPSEFRAVDLGLAVSSSLTLSW